jgi:hypothetical protein
VEKKNNKREMMTMMAMMKNQIPFKARIIGILVPVRGGFPAVSAHQRPTTSSIENTKMNHHQSSPNTLTTSDRRNLSAKTCIESTKIYVHDPAASSNGVLEIFSEALALPVTS